MAAVTPQTNNRPSQAQRQRRKTGLRKRETTRATLAEVDVKRMNGFLVEKLVHIHRIGGFQRRYERCVGVRVMLATIFYPKLINLWHGVRVYWMVPNTKYMLSILAVILIIARFISWFYSGSNKHAPATLLHGAYRMSVRYRRTSVILPCKLRTSHVSKQALDYLV